MKAELIQFAPLFAGLDEQERSILAAGFADGQCSANATLLNAGDRATSIYLIGHGFVSLVTPGGQNLATLGPGSILGEASLLRGAPLDVSAKALADLTFWKLTDSALREIILQQPSIGIKLSRNFGSLLIQMQDYLAQRLAKTPELAGLPPHTLQAVAQRLKPLELRTSSALFRSGDVPQGLYLLESGAMELRGDRPVDGQRAQAAKPGQLLGAAALLTGKPALHTAVAVEDSLLWQLSTDEFQSLSAQQPGLRRALARSARAALGREDQAQAVSWLAQMPMFAEVPPDNLRAVAERMVLQHVPAGERVYTMGESGNALYLIENGEIELTAENASGVVEELARVGSGGHFGERGLLTGQIYTEDATAIRHTNLWILQRSELDSLSAKYPAIGKALTQGMALRLATDEGPGPDDRFRMFSLFSDLSREELNQIAEYLRPMRYRAGEQIFRASTPADMLFLLEAGQVRMQSFSGGWIVGPGEAFGERALLTNQPHNASAVAETDVDVWTLAKRDFDMLMARYPSLAISMSRMLTQRLTQMEMGGMHDDARSPGVYAPPPPSGANMPSRRQQAQSYDLPPAPASRERVGFAEWFTNLTTFGKVRFALLVLLIIWLIGVAAPWALLSLLQGNTRVASGADDVGMDQRTGLFNAISEVYAIGSYELASRDRELAEVLAMADQQVPPTATPTPPPTVTPIPTSTPLPTATPLPTNTPLPTATLRPFIQEVMPAEPPTPEPEVVAAAAVPSRMWDPRLDRLGVYVEEAQVPPGQQYWRIIETKWGDEQESGGKHHIYVEVLDENGQRLVGQPVTVFWGDGSATIPTENKAPPDFAFNYMMYAAGNAYNVKVEGLPSDVLRGAGMGDMERPKYGIHTTFYVTFQRVTK